MNTASVLVPIKSSRRLLDGWITAVAVLLTLPGVVALVRWSRIGSIQTPFAAVPPLLALAQIIIAAGLPFQRTRRPAALCLVPLLLLGWGDSFSLPAPGPDVYRWIQWAFSPVWIVFLLLATTPPRCDWRSLTESSSWLAGAGGGVMATRVWLTGHDLRGWLIWGALLAYGCGLAVLVAVKFGQRSRGGFAAGPAASSGFEKDPIGRAGRWQVNVGFWITVAVATAGLTLWSLGRGGSLTRFEMAYVFADRLAIYAAVLGVVYVAGRAAQLQRSPIPHGTVSLAGAALPAMLVLDFLVCDKTGIPLLDWLPGLADANPAVFVSGLLRWSGHPPIGWILLGGGSLIVSLLGMRALSGISRRTEAVLGIRASFLVLLAVGLAAATLEGMAPHALAASTEQRLSSISQLRFLQGNDGPAIAVTIRQPPNAPTGAQLQSLSAAAIKPDIFIFVVESLRTDAINTLVAPRLSAFRDSAWSADRTFAASYSSNLSWFSVFHAQQAFRWSTGVDDGQGALPLRLLKRLGYRVEVRLAGDHQWKGMATRNFGSQHYLADSFVDANSGFAERPNHERDRLLMNQLVDAAGAAPEGGHLYVQEFMSTHWGYDWAAGDDVPFHEFAPVADFTRLNYSSHDVQLLKNRYLNAVSQVDRLFGQFEDALKASGRYDRSLVIVLGDHGEDFREEGRWLHGSSLCRHQTEVPILIKWPAAVRPPARRLLMGHIDVMPSILQVLGVNASLLGSLEGISAYQSRTSLVISNDRPSRVSPGIVFVNGNRRTEAAYWSSAANGPPDRLRIVNQTDWLDRTLPVAPGIGLTALEQAFPEAASELFEP